MLSSSKSWLHLSSCAGAAAAECVRVTSPSQATVSPLFHPSGSGQPDACSCCLCACCQALLLSLERVSCCLSGCAGASSSCPCACRQPWPLCCAPEKREVNLPVCCRKLYADEKAKLDAKQAAAKAAAMVGPLGAVRLLGSKPVSNDSTAGNHRHAQVSVLRHTPIQKAVSTHLQVLGAAAVGAAKATLPALDSAVPRDAKSATSAAPSAAAAVPPLALGSLSAMPGGSAAHHAGAGSTAVGLLHVTGAGAEAATSSSSSGSSPTLSMDGEPAGAVQALRGLCCMIWSSSAT